MNATTYTYAADRTGRARATNAGRLAQITRTQDAARVETIRRNRAMARVALVAAPMIAMIIALI